MKTSIEKTKKQAPLIRNSREKILARLGGGLISNET